MGLIKNELKDLCIIVIFMLDSLKKEGLISEEEYIKNTKVKEEFLENFSERVI
ncbi:MAG: Conjugal transfer protein [Sporanaerobacter sp.]|jgi:hypothetical protein|uniref:hypothetical protein n=1 Tax=Sporanaerobacter sp. TaxID=2010183 RepID=UPI003A0FF7EE